MEKESQNHRVRKQKGNALPRLIRTPWGYLSRGQALLNYRQGVPHPDITRIGYDTKNKRAIYVDWTVPGEVERYIGISNLDEEVPLTLGEQKQEGLS